MKQNDSSSSIVPIDFVNEAQEQLIESLRTDPKYIAKADPTGQLNLSEEQKKFIDAYVQFRNVPLASQLSGIDESQGTKYFMDEKCRGEIRRINLALYAKQFSRRLLTIDEIGGYLTSVLMNQDVVERDVLTAKDKLNVAKMIIDLNVLKMQSFDNPSKLDIIGVESDVKDLSAEQIKKLIAQTMAPTKEDVKAKKEVYDEKSFLISKLNEGGWFDPAEIAYLQSCSVEQLRELLEKGIGENEEKSGDQDPSVQS